MLVSLTGGAGGLSSSMDPHSGTRRDRESSVTGWKQEDLPE
jgi:hypothetical protein